MSLFICRKVVFEFKIFRETCKIITRFDIQVVFRKKSQLESFLLVKNSGKSPFR